MQPDETLEALGLVLTDMVSEPIRQAVRATRVGSVAVGSVLQVDGSTAMVEMDDGGVPGAPHRGVIHAVRMQGVEVGDRVRVHFMPAAGAEAHRVAG